MLVFDSTNDDNIDSVADLVSGKEGRDRKESWLLRKSIRFDGIPMVLGKFRAVSHEETEEKANKRREKALEQSILFRDLFDIDSTSIAMQ